MKNIVMARIDERLLHGQVVVSWLPYINVNEVMVVDDENANDEFMKELIISSAPENIKTNVFSLKDAIDYISNNDMNDNDRVFIVTKQISNIIELIKNDINIDKVNLGGLGFNSNRKRFLNFISLSNDELTKLKELNDLLNDRLEIQMVPNDKMYTFKDLIGK